MLTLKNAAEAEGTSEDDVVWLVKKSGLVLESLSVKGDLAYLEELEFMTS